MEALSTNDLADLMFWSVIVLGSMICFGLGFIGGQQR